MRLLVAFAILMTAAAPAVAQEAEPEDKMVCKRIDQGETGSHMRRSKKICKKASEWRLIEEQTGRSLRAIRDRSGVNPNDVGGRQ